MRIFLTGATGYIGSAILEASLRAGHSVTALVRDPEKAEHVSLRGGRPVVGELAKPAGYVALAEEADVIVHAAYDRSKRSVDVDRRAIETLLGAAGRRLDKGQAASFHLHIGRVGAGRHGWSRRGGRAAQADTTRRVAPGA